MSKSNITRDQVILAVKQILLDIINPDLDAALDIDSIKDEDEIAESTVMKMDSIKAIKMIVEIERRFGISVPDEDLDMKNFHNVTTIASYVLMKNNSSGDNCTCG